MTQLRIVSPEALDFLPEHDPAAIRSRKDLRRIHAVMRTRKTILHELSESVLSHNPSRPHAGIDAKPVRVLELGAGDGSLMLGIASALRTSATAMGYDNHPRVDLTLLDRQNLISQSIITGYASQGWHAKPMVVDALDWAKTNTDTNLKSYLSPRWDLIFSNLFLHHFEGKQLSMLLSAIELRTDHFVAVEPRRGWLPLAGSHLIGAIGANLVTRKDAVLSVHAGFRDAELSSLWPSSATHESVWDLREYPAGLFSHCFTGQRKSRSVPIKIDAYPL